MFFSSKLNIQGVGRGDKGPISEISRVRQSAQCRKSEESKANGNPSFREFGTIHVSVVDKPSSKILFFFLVTFTPF